MAKCYLCDSEITSTNETKEHIFLNAIGGRLKSKELICITCNSNFGEKCDSVLARQLNFLANLLNIGRERGTPQPIVTTHLKTGEGFKIEPGGNPVLEKPQVEKQTNKDKTQYSIMARSFPELRKIMKGIAMDHPTIDIEEVLQIAKKKGEYLNDPLHFEAKVGGADALRSICKSAVNFYIYKGGDKRFVSHLIEYLKGQNGSDPDVVFHFHPCTPIHPLSKTEVSHLIYLRGNSKEKILFSVIEFFNSFSFLVKLNLDYDGPKMEETYCFDVLERVEISKKVSLGCSVSFIKGFSRGHTQDDRNLLVTKLNRVINIALEIQDKKHRDELISKAMANLLCKHPESPIITEEMINEFIQELLKEISPYIVNKLPK